MAHTHPTAKPRPFKSEFCPFDPDSDEETQNARHLASIARQGHIVRSLEKYADPIRAYFYRGFTPAGLAHIYRVPVEAMREFVNDHLGLEFDSDWGKELPGVELRTSAPIPTQKPLRNAEDVCPFDSTPGHPARSLPTPKPSRKDGKDRGTIRLKTRASNQRRLFH